MVIAGSIEVIAHDLARRVDPHGIGSNSAGHVERGVATLIEQETMGVDIAGIISVPSHDLARGVYAGGIGIKRAGHVERGVAALIEQEAVYQAACIGVVSHDLARGVDPVRKGLP